MHVQLKECEQIIVPDPPPKNRKQKYYPEKWSCKLFLLFVVCARVHLDAESNLKPTSGRQIHAMYHFDGRALALLASNFFKSAKIWCRYRINLWLQSLDSPAQRLEALPLAKDRWNHNWASLLCAWLCQVGIMPIGRLVNTLKKGWPLIVRCCPLLSVVVR